MARRVPSFAAVFASGLYSLLRLLIEANVTRQRDLAELHAEVLVLVIRCRCLSARSRESAGPGAMIEKRSGP